MPWEGNLAALRALAEVFEVRPHFEWRGLGFISQSALRIRESFAPWDAEKDDADPRRVRGRSQGGPMRRSAQGRSQAAPVQAVRQGMHAGASDRRLMVSSEGACAAHFKYGVARATRDHSTRDRRLARSPPLRSAPCQTTPEQCSVEFHDKQISMAHGAGGEASRRLVEGLIQPAVFQSVARSACPTPPRSNPGAAGLAMTADSFVVQPLAFPGGSIGELASTAR